MPASTAPFFSDDDARLTREIGIVDTHNDLASAVIHRRFQGTYDSLGAYWLPRLEAGGVRVVVCPVWIDSPYLPHSAMQHAVPVIDGLYAELRENHERIELARSYADIERTNGAGKIAALLSFEGAEPLGQDLSALRLFHEVGLRMLSFTWNRRTAFGDGAWENDSHGGLTRLGRQAVREMHRLGIIMDISHASDQTTRDIFEAAEGPVIASHSNARALCEHPRNLPDKLIRGLAATGGVMGIAAVSRFITEDEPTIARWVDHVEHIVGLVGIEHVGIGADFAHHLYEIGAAIGVGEWSPEQVTARQPFVGMLSPEDLPGLTAELRRRGFGEAEIRKIYHENHLRVMRQVLQ
jgi:membrane dipeptidase